MIQQQHLLGLTPKYTGLSYIYGITYNHLPALYRRGACVPHSANLWGKAESNGNVPGKKDEDMASQKWNAMIY